MSHYEISETQLIAKVKAGVHRTMTLMHLASNFHGKPIAIEYLLTTDIYREFLDTFPETDVELQYRKVINALTSDDPRSGCKKVRRTRADIAIRYSPMIAVAFIELKIGIAKLRGIKGDLDKLVTVYGILKPSHARRLRGAVVFQMHVVEKKRLLGVEKLLATMDRKEENLKGELAGYAKAHPHLRFRMEPLQNNAGSATPGDEDEDGYCIRNYIILVRDTRPDVPQQRRPWQRPTRT